MMMMLNSNNTSASDNPSAPVIITTHRSSNNYQGNNNNNHFFPDTSLIGQNNLPAGFVGIYSPEQRRHRIERFEQKRKNRVWTKKVKYDVRKNFADSRLRVKGRFVKKEDEDIMRDLIDMI